MRVLAQGRYHGLPRVQEGQEIMIHLGYPVYVLTIPGLANTLGALAIWQERLTLLKEWAYAGSAFHYPGAFASRAFADDSVNACYAALIIHGRYDEMHAEMA